MSVIKFTQINRDKCYPLFENGRFRGVIVPADVEKVVRCRDCLHHKPLEILEGGHICEVFNWQSRDYDFCSFAERRTE